MPRVLRHLRHNPAGDLPAVLDDEDVGVLMLEPVDLVSVLAHPGRREEARQSLPLEDERGGLLAAGHAQACRVEVRSLEFERTSDIRMSLDPTSSSAFHSWRILLFRKPRHL